jgi:hypothetical protein
MSDLPPPLPTDPPPAPVPVIDYDTPPRADHVRRQKYLIVLGAAIVLGGALVGLLLLRMVQPRAMTVASVTVVPTTPSQTQYQMQQQWGRQQLDQMLANEPAQGTVVYEEDAASAAALKGQPGMQEADRQNMSQPLWGAFQPPIFLLAPFQQEHGGGPTGLLFAHERVSPAGNRRLVIMDIAVTLQTRNHKGDEADIAIDRQLKYRICETKLFTTAPSVLRYGQSLKIAQSGDGNVIPIRWIDGSLRAARPPERNLSFLAGQVDRKDASHFTIDYALGKQTSTIDVYLTDDDFLRVIPHGGKIDGGTWRIDVPSTQPVEAAH